MMIKKLRKKLSEAIYNKKELHPFEKMIQDEAEKKFIEGGRLDLAMFYVTEFNTVSLIMVDNNNVNKAIDDLRRLADEDGYK